MKQRASRLLTLLFIVAALLTACGTPPTPVATLAATAVVPTSPPDAGVTLQPTPTVAQAQTPTGDATPEATFEAEAPDATAAAATEVAATEVAYAAIVAAPATPTQTPTAIPSPTPNPPPVYGYEVVNAFPHDPGAFTQGLVYHEGGLYEGTGRWGESTLREVALQSGAVLRSQPLEPQYFGEGITLFNDRVYQLTWQEETGFVYDRATFALLDTFTYPHEGWGITHDGQRLIVSDGTADIRFWDPATLQETGRITVRDDMGPVNRLNELEYIDGEIWANIWLTDRIARISPETGDVIGYIDLTGLLDTSALSQPVDVLNGIAYDAEDGRIFVTGKLWPTLYEIRVVEK